MFHLNSLHQLNSDIITLIGSSKSDVEMKEKNIAVPADLLKFKQVDGFQYAVVANSTVRCSDVGLPKNCKYYLDTSTHMSYLFYYPNDDTVRYLYEQYPKQISPIRGVTDEHFIVWMRTAALPRFRKLYGRIEQNFVKGDSIRFNIQANFEVRSFNGDKAIVIGTASASGGKNISLGLAFLVSGCLGIFLAIGFWVQYKLNPRFLGDQRLLRWD